jgi:hypothetical protein
VACRPRLAFPPSYPFEFNGLDNWVICLLGPILLLLGFTPVHRSCQRVSLNALVNELKTKLLEKINLRETKI